MAQTEGAMMFRRRISLIALAAVAAMTFSVMPATADGSDRAEPAPVERANPGLSKVILDSLPQAVKESSVKIDPSYRPGTPIVYPDGALVPGQSDSIKAKAAVSCGGFVAAPGTGSWGPTSVSNCAVFGSPGWKVTYSWSRAVAVYTTGCVRGKAYNSSGTRYWMSGGCGTHAYFNAPWGNILATPETQAFSQGVPAGFSAYWTH